MAYAEQRKPLASCPLTSPSRGCQKPLVVFFVIRISRQATIGQKSCTFFCHCTSAIEHFLDGYPGVGPSSYINNFTNSFFSKKLAPKNPLSFYELVRTLGSRRQSTDSQNAFS
jgi:hypothetical protein